MKAPFVLFSVGMGLCCMAACESGLSLDALLVNRPCRGAEPRCLDGFECIADECVRLGDGQGGTEGGQGGRAGSAGGGNGSGGFASGGVAGSGAGAAGTGAAGSTAGAAGSHGGSEDASVPDASPPPGDSGCVQVPLYRDRDGDGYGSKLPEDEAFGCSLEGFVSVSGDCRDAVPSFFDQADLVHPGQTQFFYVSYVDPDRAGGVSFDYDCSGEEEAAPTNSPSGPPPDCASLLTCSGQGFRDEGRSGPGIIGQCGSEFLVSCTVQNITQCVAVEEPVMTGGPFACR